MTICLPSELKQDHIYDLYSAFYPLPPEAENLICDLLGARDSCQSGSRNVSYLSLYLVQDGYECTLDWITVYVVWVFFVNESPMRARSSVCESNLFSSSAMAIIVLHV